VTEPTQTSVHTLSGAYVADALDDTERAAFEEHLPGCADCSAEISSFREAAALLALDAELTPPDSLRSGVLAGIRTIRPLPPETGSNVVALRGRRFRWGTLAVAAAVLAIMAIAAVAQPWQNHDASTASSAIDRVMSANDATHVKVSFLDGATATVFRSVSERRAAVVTDHMPSAPAGKVYELWLQKPSGVMVPAGLMKGSGDHRMLLQGNAARASAAAISVEPAGGSSSPTSEPVAVFDFAHA
jgi:anti-sigma-K factor RskA